MDAPEHPDAPRPDARQHLIAAWGIFGVCLLLLQAIWRLVPHAVEPVVEGMQGWQWALYAGWIVVNGWAEGYRGFQKRFSPRVVERAYWLARHPRPLYVALAPVYCMSYLHASRRGKTVAWALLVFIVLAVVAVRLMGQPWRGIVDAGVVVGLVWGLAVILYFWWRALRVLPGPPNDLPASARGA